MAEEEFKHWEFQLCNRIPITDSVPGLPVALSLRHVGHSGRLLMGMRVLRVAERWRCQRHYRASLKQMFYENHAD